MLLNPYMQAIAEVYPLFSVGSTQPYPILKFSGLVSGSNSDAVYPVAKFSIIPQEGA